MIYRKQLDSTRMISIDSHLLHLSISLPSCTNNLYYPLASIGIASDDVLNSTH